MENTFSFCFRHENGTSEVIDANVSVHIDAWTIFDDHLVISYLENWDSEKIYSICQNPMEKIGRSCNVRIVIHTSRDEAELTIIDRKTNEELLHETQKSHGEKVERIGNKITIILSQSDNHAE